MAAQVKNSTPSLARLQRVYAPKIIAFAPSPPSTVGGLFGWPLRLECNLEGRGKFMTNYFGKQPSSRPIKYQVLAYAGGGSSVPSTNFSAETW
jgi:hypothetical protein